MGNVPGSPTSGARGSALAFCAGAGLASLAWYLEGRRRFKGRIALPAGPPAKGGGDGTGRYVGVDLGATTVNVALASDTGSILGRASVDLPSDRSFKSVTGLLVATIKQVVAAADHKLADVTAIGIGAPGNLDCENGVVRNAANFGWTNAPLTAALEEGTGRPAVLENDANAAVLAEWWAGVGAAKDIKHLVMFTLGTGVGGGVVSDNRLIRGATGMAGELGHSIIEPFVGDAKRGRLCAGTGVHGILEQYASARAVGVRAREALDAPGGSASSMAKLTKVTAKDVFEHAAAGDSVARHLVEETAEYLAIGFINACRHFDPQLIVISGGMSLAGEALLEPLRRHFCSRWWSIQPTSTCRVVQASTGNDAGMLGAAAAARVRLGPRV